jgi:hypothetical protein
MAEGMWEIAEDDGDEARADTLDAIVMATPGTEGMGYPVTFTVPASVALQDVLDNLEMEEGE